MSYPRSKLSRSLRHPLSLSHAISGVFSSSSSPMARFLATISVIFSLFIFFNTFFFFFPLSSSSYSPADHVDGSAPRTVSFLASDPMVTLHPGFNSRVRVYMYDLPRKFTYGVVESYLRARGVLKKSSTSSVGGVSGRDEVRYPGNQHSAEWCLFADLNKEEKDRINSPVVRVFDPEEADLFYVPFFSSLSLVANPIRANGVGGGGVGGPEVKKVYSDEEMQESLIEWLEGQLYWKRNNGRDHVFICQDPNALYKVVDKVKNSVLLVSDFGRLKPDQSSLIKDVILPYSHRIRSFEGEVGVRERKSLLFFMGNRFRKEGGKIRDMLFQVLEDEEGVMMKHGAQSRESRRAATHGMHTSKFCLHPAGDTPSACRLFDAIVSLCVPVIVSDDIELPFEDVIDYHKIAIFVDSASAVKKGFLVKLLKAVSTAKVLAYQQEIKKVKHYFEYDDPNGTVNEIWRQVSLKLPTVKLMINRDKRLVNRELPQADCSCLCSNRSEIVKHSGTVTL